MRKCIECGEKIEGRIDKIYCSFYCKSNHHYKRNIEKEKGLYGVIDKQLKLNRRLLNHYNKAGKAVIRKTELLKAGFNPKYFTHYWKNQKGDVYLFCYEYGFLEKKEGEKVKYVLVQWQEYMNS
jgi:hypothetical protein